MKHAVCNAFHLSSDKDTKRRELRPVDGSETCKVVLDVMVGGQDLFAEMVKGKGMEGREKVRLLDSLVSCNDEELCIFPGGGVQGGILKMHPTEVLLVISWNGFGALLLGKRIDFIVFLN